MNIANKLTVFRITLIPIIVLIYLFPYAQFNITVMRVTIENISISYVDIAALILFSVASFTDFLDGYLARSKGMITVFGKFLDPIADKLLVNTMFILFASKGIVPVVAVLIMIWRDTVVDAVRMLLSQKGLVMAAGYLGKFKTVAQMLAIVVILLNNMPFEFYNIPVSSMLLWFATLMSALSGASYLIQSRVYFTETM